MNERAKKCSGFVSSITIWNNKKKSISLHHPNVQFGLNGSSIDTKMKMKKTEEAALLIENENHWHAEQQFRLTRGKERWFEQVSSSNPTDDDSDLISDESHFY